MLLINTIYVHDRHKYYYYFNVVKHVRKKLSRDTRLLLRLKIAGGGGGGGALKKMAPRVGRLEKCFGNSCEKSRFYAKKSYFFQSAPELSKSFERFL